MWVILGLFALPVLYFGYFVVFGQFRFLDYLRYLAYFRTILTYVRQVQITQYKKLRETARCFVSLNISVSHSRSLKIIRNHTLE